MFYYFMSSMIFKRLVLPESILIYSISNDIASGYGMINIISTVCSYGMFATTFNKCLKGKRELSRTRLVIVGDDVVDKMPIFKVILVSNKLKFVVV